MSNQYLKLRRSSVPGKIPETSSIDYGEIALNIYDGLAFMKKSGSNGEEVVPIGSSSGSFTGNFTGTFTGSLQGTSSYYNETDPVFTAVSGTFATTGSNTFQGNQVISGSLSQGSGIVSGFYSHAEGESTVASGSHSHAEGSVTQAVGDYSHAEGDYTQAIGNYSHAEGQETIASGQYSHAEGYSTIASANHQHVQGQWNVTSSVQSAFIVGNGTDNNNRSNLIHAAGNEVQITGSIIFNEGARITPTYYGNTYTGYIDIVAGGPDGFVELLSYNSQSSFTVDDSGAYLLTSASYLWQFNNNGVLEAPGGIEAPSFTGSLQGTASWALNAVNAATASNILGGKATHIPYFITDTTLATSSLYQSGSTSIIINQDANTTSNPEALYVWQPHPTSINVISGKGDIDNYLQLNIQNTNQGEDASSDVVATAANGSENDNYIDMGINSQNYTGFLGGPNDSYLYSHGHDMWIGNINDGYSLHLFNSSSENPLITLTPSNTVDVNTTLNASDITGSLYGTASWARNATSASFASNAANASQASTASFVQQAQTAISSSYASNAGYADYAATAGNAANGGVTQIVAGSGIALIPSTGLGAVTVISSGTGGGISVISGSNVTQSFNNLSTWTFNHDLGVRTPVIQAFDSNYSQIIPQSITLLDATSSILTFPVNKSGFAIASIGGVTGNAISSSYALFSTYADTASFYAETDPVFVARSASLATTGSNVFRGTQTVTGSLFTSGSNTLIGNTVLSGSISISGSTTLNGSTSFYGTHILSGSNTINGNTVMSGSIEVSGSSNFKNSVFIVTGSAFFKGIHQVSGSTSITGSFNVVDGDINIVSGSSFTRWGNKLFNYGQFSDTTIQSGSANTAYAMKFNTTDFALNTRIVSGSRITVDNTGIYNLQFSAQLGNTANSTIDFDIWFAYTGSNVANSNTNVTLNKVAGGNGRLVAAWNFAYPMTSGSYIEIMWSCNDSTGQLQSTGTQITPSRPAIPSVIATLTQIA